MNTVLVSLGVSIFAILALLWFVSGTIKSAQRRIDEEEEARVEALKRRNKIDSLLECDDYKRGLFDQDNQ